MTSLQAVAAGTERSDPIGNALREFAVGGLANPPPVSVAWWRLVPSASTDSESHAVAEMWLIASGTGEMNVDAHMRTVSPGELLYIEPGAKHHVTASGSEPLCVFSIWWPADHAEGAEQEQAQHGLQAPGQTAASGE